MVRKQVRLTQEQSRALKLLAAQRGVSVSEPIRQAIDQLLAGSATGAERREPALAAAGKFRSGHADLSTDHDRYFAADCR